ncbi:MAG: hypothetical protein CK430_07050 [Legionella sp.]|nr:MAG: hypothetical protein CK430_07050 [Legionella sp.]
MVSILIITKLRHINTASILQPNDIHANFFMSNIIVLCAYKLIMTDLINLAKYFNVIKVCIY